MYFTSKQAEYIFYIVELDGALRSKKLGYSQFIASDKKQLKKWYENILNIINNGDHPMKDTAINELNKLYQRVNMF